MAESSEHDSLFQHLIENIPDILSVYDSDGRCTYQNPASATLGWTPDELVGGSALEHAHPDDRGAVGDWMRACAENPGIPRPLTYRRRCKDGSWRLLESVGKAIAGPDGRTKQLVTARDVTERKNAEEQRSLMAVAIDHCGNLISISKPGGAIEYVNKRYLEITGFSAEELVGKTFLEVGIIPLQLLADMNAKIFAGLEWRGEVERTTKSGEKFWTSTVITPIRDASNSIAHAIAVHEDVTERKSLEEQVRRFQKTEAIAMLASGVAHDFNNFVTAILCSTGYMAKHLRAGDPQREILNEIEEAARGAATLTRQMLSFARPQAVKAEPLRLDIVLHQIEKLLRKLIDARIELVIIPPVSLGWVLADATQIEQVMMNLAANARDAMPEGGKLIIELKNVRIDQAASAQHPGFKSGDYVQLCVSDTGAGMSPETQERLFEPFFSTKPAGKGTGLGLAICRGIVKENGGHIWIYSEVGRGTTVKVYLPRLSEGAPEKVEPRDAEKLVGGKETILVAEDDGLARRVVVRTLANLGYKVLVSTNGDEAVRTHERASKDTKIDLFFTDLVMPLLGGNEAAEQLLRRDPKLRVLFTSGYTDRSVKHMGVLDANKNFLSKPYSPSELARKIRAVLDD